MGVRGGEEVEALPIGPILQKTVCLYCMRVQNWRAIKGKLTVLLRGKQVYLRLRAETIYPNEGRLIEKSLGIYGFVPGEGVRYGIPNSCYVEGREKPASSP